MASIPKWGFGMAPFKQETATKYRMALSQVMKYISTDDVISEMQISDSISTVKGMFNRILRQDQWDWFMVNMYFDYPLIGEISRIIQILIELRKASIISDSLATDTYKKQLMKTNFLKYTKNFLIYKEKESEASSDEYVYILSRREEKELLKIGRTTRNVAKRVHEINSATGMLYPLSARKVYRVVDGTQAEKCVHQALSQFRVRNDREFFILPFSEACRIIESLLSENDLYYYKY